VVVPNAVESQFRPLSGARAAIQQGTVQSAIRAYCRRSTTSRVRITGLAAFEDVVNSEPHLQHDLMFVGKETWYSELHRAVEHSSVRDRVHLRVCGRCRSGAFTELRLFVFPSFYGVQRLAILSVRGRAVACSNLTAMPEVPTLPAFCSTRSIKIARAMLDVLLDRTAA
jgi:hypothetical protein